MDSDDPNKKFSPCPPNTAPPQQVNFGYPPPYSQPAYYPSQPGYGQPRQPGYGPQQGYGAPPRAQQAPYYPPYPNEGPQYGYPHPAADEFDHVKDHGDVYTSSPIWRDVWAAVLYVLNLVVFIGVVVWGTMGIAEQINHLVNDIDNMNDFISLRAALPTDLVDQMLEMQAMALRTFPAMLGISVLYTMLYLFCAYKFTRAFAVVYWLVYSIFMFAGAGALFAIKVWIPASILLSFGFTLICNYFHWRSRISLDSLLLQNTMKVIRLHPSMLIVGGMGLLVQGLVTILWVLGIIGVNARLLSGAQFDSNTAFLMLFLSVFLTFAYFWSSQVIKNVCHTTCSGAYATFHFLEAGGVNVENTVGQAAMRAMSYSFGSICFGSLFIKQIQTLLWLARLVRTRGIVAACCADKIIPEYFNLYAYTQVAIYGKSFLQAARDTWQLVQNRGIVAIINENLIGIMLWMGQMFIGLLCGVIAWVIASSANTIRPDSQWFAISLAIICGLFAILVMSIACGIIESGTATTFVCLAEDPAALKRSNPELFAKFLEKYQAILRPASERGYPVANKTKQI